MPMTNNHAIIVLASGLSQRLGQSKQLLSKDSEPLISCMLKLALATKPEAVFIVIPQDGLEIATAITELNTENSIIYPVLNFTPETGMAHSLFLAIEALNDINNLSISADNRRVLIMGIDQVFLDSGHLTKLLAGRHSVVASSYPHLNEDFSINNSKPNIVGLPINIDYELLKQWQSELVGDKGLRHLIRALSSEQISMVINQQLSYDIDTPKQFIHAQQQGWLDS